MALNGSSDDLDANCDGDDWQKRECQSRRIQVLDAKLNSVYELVLSKAATREDGPDFIRALRKSQRAWLAFKDSNCEVYAVLPMARSDTWKTLYRQDCLAETLKERIEELTRIANNE